MSSTAKKPGKMFRFFIASSPFQAFRVRRCFLAVTRKDRAIMWLSTGCERGVKGTFSSISTNFVLQIYVSGNKRRDCRFMLNVQSWRKRLPHNTVSKCFLKGMMIDEFIENVCSAACSFYFHLRGLQ